MATKYFMSGGVDNDWSGDDNWSTTASSGPNNTTHAVAADAVILDAGSPNCTVDTASACTSIVCTGYTGTLTMNADMTTTGNITLVSGMTFTPNSTTWNVGCNGGTITGGGKNFNNVNFNVTGTLTIGGANLSIDGDLSVATGVTATLSGSYDITASKGLTCTGTGVITGRTITLDGSGTWQSTGTGSIKSNLTINTGGTIVLGTNVYYGTSTLLYTAGTVTATGSTLNINGSCTLHDDSAGGNTFESINGTANATLTLTHAISLAGNLSVATSTTLTFATSNITIKGNLTLTGGLTGSGRTVTLAPILSTTSTWSGAGSLAVTTLTINGAGAFVVSGSVAINGTGITYTAASSVTTTGSTLNISNNVTLNCASIAWNNVTLVWMGTLTLTGALDIDGNLDVRSGFTFTTNDITVAGSLSFTYAGSAAYLTATSPRKVTLNGTGSVTCSSTTIGVNYCSCDLVINTAGTITFSGVVFWGTGNFTLTYTAGTIDWGTSTLCVLGNTSTVQTLNLPNQTLYNLYLYSNTNTTAGATVKFTAGTTVSVSNQFTVCHITGAVYAIATTSASSDANLNLTNTSLFPIVSGSVNFTDIDCSGGRAILSPGATLTRCTNIVNSWTSYPRTSAGAWA